jgi:hypothetical protein
MTPMSGTTSPAGTAPRSPSVSEPVRAAPDLVPNAACVWRAVELLVEAYDCACALGKDVWEFAVEVGTLHASGPTNTTLRWLLEMGYTAHAIESPKPEEGRRTFRPVLNLSIPDGACFVLTPAGAEFARRPRAAGPLAAPSLPSVVPVWDRLRRELRVRETVVKRYRQPAGVQELILLTFEEEGWPGRIDDPLPPQPGRDSKRRLHTTIVNLNRFQKRRLIQFEGGGDGQSVCWRLRPDE